jgi:hypothetical protein
MRRPEMGVAADLRMSAKASSSHLQYRIWIIAEGFPILLSQLIHMIKTGLLIGTPNATILRGQPHAPALRPHLDFRTESPKAVLCDGLLNLLCLSRNKHSSQVPR